LLLFLQLWIIAATYFFWHHGSNKLDDFLLNHLCSFIGRFSHLASSNNIIVTAYVYLELYLINYDLFGSKIKDYTNFDNKVHMSNIHLLWLAFSFWLDLLQHHHQTSTT
jgi:hypothetical protein